MSNQNGKSVVKTPLSGGNPKSSPTSGPNTSNRPPSANANSNVNLGPAALSAAGPGAVPASGSGSRPPAKSLSTNPVQVSTATTNSSAHERRKTANNLPPPSATSHTRRDSSGVEDDDIKTLPSSSARAAAAHSLSSASSTSAASQLASSSFSAVEFECWENQRYYPFVGWTKNVLPTDFPAWSSADGSREVTFDSVKLGAGMSWAGEWQTDRRNCDEDGWQYGVDFSKNWLGTKEKKTLHLVRRRRWYRTVARPASAANSASSSSTVGASSSAALGLSVPVNKASTSTMPPMKTSNDQTKPLTSLKSLYSKPADSNITISLTAATPSPTGAAVALSSSPSPSASASSGSPTNLSPTSALSSSSSSSSSGVLGKSFKVTAVKPQTAVVRVWEHQRYYPVVGWSDKLLPTDKKHAWADDKGNKLNNGRDDVHVDNVEWKWMDDWRAVVENGIGTDKDGWQYAIDFPSSYKCRAGTTGIDCFVRRRQWQRQKVMIPGASAANKKKDTAAFFARLDAFKADLQAEADNEEIVALSSATW